MSAKDKQVGGSHYKNFAIQPIDFINKNNLGFLEGCVIKRMCRWQNKNGVEDLRKAIHEIELLIEHTEQENGSWDDVPMTTAEAVAVVPRVNPLLPECKLYSKDGNRVIRDLPNGTPVSIWSPLAPTGRRGRPRNGWVDVGFAWNGALVDHGGPS